MSHKCTKEFSLTVIIPMLCRSGVHSTLMNWITELKAIGCVCVQVIIVLDLNKCAESEAQDCRKKLALALDKLLNCSILESDFGAPGLSRNAALGLAKGRHLMFWDADDLPHISTITNLLPLKDRVIHVFGFRKVQIKNQDSVVEKIPANPSEFCRTPGIWRIAFPITSVVGLGFPAIRMGEDLVFLAKVLLIGNFEEIDMRTEITYDYYSGVAGQLTSDKSAIEDQIKAIQEIISLLKKYKDSRHLEKTIVIKIVVWQIASLIKRDPIIGLAKSLVPILSICLIWFGKVIHKNAKH